MTLTTTMFHVRDLLRSSLVLSVILSLGFAGAVCGAEPFEAFLEKHCVRCHGPQKEEGDIRIDRLSRDFKAGLDSHHWAEALDKLNSGEMPPKEEPQPTQDEIAAFVTNLDSRLKDGRAARMAARPAVAHYRLSRKEYQNTVYDLLGVRYDPAKPGELNEDTLWHGFERIGSQLSLSPSHVDRYYRAADIVLDRAFPATSAEARKVRKTAAELRYGGGEESAGGAGPVRHQAAAALPALPRSSAERAVLQLVWKDGAGTQRAVSHASSSEWYPPAWRPAGTLEHRQGDQ